MSSKYVMPFVQLGNIVLWSLGEPGVESDPAIVTRVYENCVDLNVLPHDSVSMYPKHAVHHISDPNRPKADVSAGAWQFPPIMPDRQEQLRSALEAETAPANKVEMGVKPRLESAFESKRK